MNIYTHSHKLVHYPQFSSFPTMTCPSPRILHHAFKSLLSSLFSFTRPLYEVFLHDHQLSLLVEIPPRSQSMNLLLPPRLVRQSIAFCSSNPFLFLLFYGTCLKIYTISLVDPLFGFVSTHILFDGIDIGRSLCTALCYFI